MTADSTFVRQVNDTNFDAEVMQRSHETPVIVDFWATWCQPCLALGPVLEKLAAEYEGRFILAKAETTEAANVAAAFNVSSIPALFAMIDGEIEDMQVGGLPEAQLREWIDRIIARASLAEALRIEETSPEGAEIAFRKYLNVDPDSAEALIGLGRVRLAQDDVEEASTILTELEERGFLEPEGERLKAALHLKTQDTSSIDELHKAADANPDDYEASFQLAEALAASEQHQQALERCLDLGQRDRQGAGEKARVLMIDIFRVLPEDSELTAEFRRKLSMALF